MPKNPLAEVFGYPVNNMSEDAINHRKGRLCPYHNSSGLNCTKNSATDPLGVCTILEEDHLVVTCPIRLRQDFKVVADAANFFFPNMRYVSLTEVRLKDKNGKLAGNIDIVIAALNDNDEIVDFGAVEVQAVYISGNVSKAFREYMKDPAAKYAMEWPRKNYPTPDYLSSSRKRLAPQLLLKGGILYSWGKKIAVAIDRAFFKTLPVLREVSKNKADIAWMIYDIFPCNNQNSQTFQRVELVMHKIVYSKWPEFLDTERIPIGEDIGTFLLRIESMVDNVAARGGTCQ